MSKEFEVENYTLKIDLMDIFRRMDEEAQLQFIRSLALQTNIIDIVTDYICGEDKEGSWSTEEPERRQKILERIERRHVEELGSYGPRYGWRVWDDVQTRLKQIRCKQHVYWALNHDEKFRDNWPMIHDFFTRHKIESDYTTKEADADIAEVKNMIQEALKAMNNPQRAKDDE